MTSKMPWPMTTTNFGSLWLRMGFSVTSKMFWSLITMKGSLQPQLSASDCYNIYYSNMRSFQFMCRLSRLISWGKIARFWLCISLVNFKSCGLKVAKIHGCPYRAAREPVQLLAVQHSMLPYCKNILLRSFLSILSSAIALLQYAVTRSS